MFYKHEKKRLQNKLGVIVLVYWQQDWIVANKLTLNAAKSSAIIIKPKLHFPVVEMNLSCAAGSIKVVCSAKYLGVFIDDKLNFQEYIKHLEKKVSRSVGILSKLKNYLPTHALFKLHYTLVQGFPNWGSRPPKGSRNDLQGSQRVRILIFTRKCKIGILSATPDCR